MDMYGCGFGGVLGVLGCRLGWRGGGGLAPAQAAGGGEDGRPGGAGGGTARGLGASGAGFEAGPGVGAGPRLVHVCLHRTNSPLMRRRN